MTDRQIMDKEPGAFRTISEVADELDVPQHVLRFWETRFSQIKPLKRGGGRRFYRPEDVLLIRGIRHLLYGEGYTIKGVQRILKEEGVRRVQDIGYGAGPQQDAAPSTPQVAWREQAGDPEEFPAIARPQPYATPYAGDRVASPPVASWSEASAKPEPDAFGDDGAVEAAAGRYVTGEGGAQTSGASTARPGGVAGGSYAEYDIERAHDAGRTSPQAADAAVYDSAAPGAPAQWREGGAPATGDDCSQRDGFDAPPQASFYGDMAAPADEAPYAGEGTGQPGFTGRAYAPGPGSVPEDNSAPGSAVSPGQIGGSATGQAVEMRGGRLSAERRRQLEEALAELLECRRLLAQARGADAA